MPLQPLNDLAETKIRMALYRDEMVLARNAEGRVRSQRDQYKALRNTAVEEKSALETRLATAEALSQEQREGDAKAKADFVAEIQHLCESLRAAESDRDGYSRSLKTSQEEAEKARQSLVDEKEELNGALLAAQSACKTAEVGRSGMASQLMVALSEQGDVEQDLAALQEDANDLRRSLANAKEEGKKALEMRQNELDIVYVEKETLLRTRDDLTVELTALRKEVDDLRRSLSDAKDQERDKMEALKRSQKGFDEREEKRAMTETALRASLVKEKAVQNQTKKKLVDALGAKELLDEKVNALNASLVYAEEMQAEALDKFSRDLTKSREGHVKTLVSLRKSHSTERRLSLAEMTRLRQSLDEANMREKKASDTAQVLQKGLENQEGCHAIVVGGPPKLFVMAKERHKELEVARLQRARRQDTCERSEGSQSSSDCDSDAPPGIAEDKEMSDDSKGSQSDSEEEDKELVVSLAVAEDDEETSERSSESQSDSDRVCEAPVRPRWTPSGVDVATQDRMAQRKTWTATVRTVDVWPPNSQHGNSAKRPCPKPGTSTRPVKVRRHH